MKCKGTGTLVAWAKAMGHQEAAGLLEEILEEEKAADEKLDANRGSRDQSGSRAGGTGGDEEEGMELAMAGPRSASSGRTASTGRNGSTRSSSGSSRGSSSRRLPAAGPAARKSANDVREPATGSDFPVQAPTTAPYPHPENDHEVHADDARAAGTGSTR